MNHNWWQRLNQKRKHKGLSLWQFFHLDWPLLLGLVLIGSYGIIVLMSSSNDNQGMIMAQISRLLLALVVLFIAAQIRPETYRILVPYVYGIGLFLLVVVLLIGHTGKGAQRWLGFGGFRFQPSEVMKIAVPMMVAWYLGEKELPPKLKTAVAECGADHGASIVDS